MDDPVVYSDYNALTGINNLGHITGYYGSGAASDPSEGYIVYPPYQPQNYRPIIYPEARDTYPMGLNNQKVVAGYYIGRKGNTLGFSFSKGFWSSYSRSARTAWRVHEDLQPQRPRHRRGLLPDAFKLALHSNSK